MSNLFFSLEVRKKRRNQKEYVRNRTETKQYRRRLRHQSVSSQFIGPDGSLVMIISSGALCGGCILVSNSMDVLCSRAIKSWIPSQLYWEYLE